MEIRLNRSELLSELVPMQGIVERRTTIPVLSHLLLKAEDDALHIAATDLEVSLTSSCEGEVQEEGAIAKDAAFGCANARFSFTCMTPAKSRASSTRQRIPSRNTKVPT